MTVRLGIIGECMLELRKSLSNHDSKTTKAMDMGYGGDTLNTAIYLARKGVDVSFVSALGDDPSSHWLISQWQQEGINCNSVILMHNAVPGMYLIDVDKHGERSFFYWRKQSPASRLFDEGPHLQSIIETLKEFTHLYLSGISLAILPKASRQRLFAVLADFQKAGGTIIFDGNYRPALWSSDDEAKDAYRRMYEMTDIALPTLEDEAALFGFSDATEVIDGIIDYGVAELVVKMGEAGCLTALGEDRSFVASIPTEPVDTTAAGDSFNAGYLAARFAGESTKNACRQGHELASKVIRHRGAIIPIDD